MRRAGRGMRSQPPSRADYGAGFAHHRGLRPEPHAVPRERCAQRACERQSGRVDSGVLPRRSAAAVGARTAGRLRHVRAANRDRTPGNVGATDADRRRQEVHPWAGDARPGPHGRARLRGTAEVRARHAGEGGCGALDARHSTASAIVSRRKADASRAAGDDGGRHRPDAGESQSAEATSRCEAASAAATVCRRREPAAGACHGCRPEQGVIRHRLGTSRRRGGGRRGGRQARREDRDVERGGETDRQRPRPRRRR